MRRLVSTPLTRNMGCGRSRPGCSPDSSDTEGQGSARQPARQGATPGDPGRKRGVDGRSSVAGETTSAKNASNGGSSKSSDKQQIQKPSLKNSKNSSVDSSSASPTKGDKSQSSNRPQGANYVLEVPQDLYTKTQNKGSRRRDKDSKTPKSPKLVHATTSQLEFFKMLDEKIEMGSETQTWLGACDSPDIADFQH